MTKRNKTEKGVDALVNKRMEAMGVGSLSPKPKRKAKKAARKAAEKRIQTREGFGIDGRSITEQCMMCGQHKTALELASCGRGGCQYPSTVATVLNMAVDENGRSVTNPTKGDIAAALAECSSRGEKWNPGNQVAEGARRICNRCHRVVSPNVGCVEDNCPVVKALGEPFEENALEFRPCGACHKCGKLESDLHGLRTCTKNGCIYAVRSVIDVLDTMAKGQEAVKEGKLCPHCHCHQNANERAACDLQGCPYYLDLSTVRTRVDHEENPLSKPDVTINGRYAEGKFRHETNDERGMWTYTWSGRFRVDIDNRVDVLFFDFVYENFCGEKAYDGEVRVHILSSVGIRDAKVAVDGLNVMGSRLMRLLSILPYVAQDAVQMEKKS